MARKLGRYAQADLMSIERAISMQGRSIARIQQDFAAEEEPYTLESKTWDELMQEREDAERNGTLTEFDAKVASALVPMLEQVLAQMSQQGQVTND